MYIQKRSDYLDNVKAFLILSVVIGHFADQIIKGSNLSKSIFLFIYAFHMPLFIFLNGYLGKNIIQSKERVIKRISYFFLLYLLLKLLIFLTKCIFHKNPSFSFLVEGGIPWYLFATSVFYGLTYLLRNVEIKFLIISSFLLGIISGYDTKIGDFLCISRVLVFYPFFLIGYALPSYSTKIPSLNRWSIFSCVFLILTFIFTALFIERLYFFRSLFTGRHSFSFLDNHFYLGGLYRVVSYVISFVIGFNFMLSVPTRKLPYLTNLGRRTLSIYFWHRPIIYILVFLEFHQILEEWAGWRIGKALWISLSILLTLFLSLGAFQRPLDWIKKRIDASYSSKQ